MEKITGLSSIYSPFSWENGSSARLYFSASLWLGMAKYDHEAMF